MSNSQIKEETIQRAFSIAEKSGDTITEENAEGYFLSALAEEIELMKNLRDTAKGNESLRSISNNMAYRMYKQAV